MDILLPIVVIFIAVFTQSLAGFGVALIAMALLPGMLGVQIATPLVALIAVTIEVFLLIRYRSSLNLGAILPVTLASIAGIPLGVWALKGVDEEVLLGVLGVVITSYALYALLNLKLPDLRNRVWAIGVGFIAGILGGAYNTSGPPVIIYGDCRRWPPAEFKSNLQGFFLVSSTFVALSHAVSSNFNSFVWRFYLLSLPAMALGILLGISLDRYLDAARFRKIVLLLLIVMGLRLAISSVGALVEIR